jgi:hypothetical protein
MGASAAAAYLPAAQATHVAMEVAATVVEALPAAHDEQEVAPAAE